MSVGGAKVSAARCGGREIVQRGPLPAVVGERARTSRRLRGRTVLLAGVLCLWLGQACSESDPARIGADRFVDSYYVEIDLPRARERSIGLARAKVDRTMRLLEGVDGPESDAKPTVYYRMVEERRDNRERGIAFEDHANVTNATTTRRTTAATTRPRRDQKGATAS